MELMYTNASQMTPTLLLLLLALSSHLISSLALPGRVVFSLSSKEIALGNSGDRYCIESDEEAAERDTYIHTYVRSGGEWGIAATRRSSMMLRRWT